jgi:hypothetical protein
MLSLGCTASAKAHLSESATITPLYDKASKMLTVTVRLLEGVHAYAEGETVGRPVRLVVNPENGWKVAGPVLLPVGKEHTLKSLVKSVILEGSFNLKATVEGGQGPITGQLSLQVCSDEGCDRPRVHSFSVTP